MIIIQDDVSITNFGAWSGGEDTQTKIIEENKEGEFDALIEELYPDGLTATDLNDILWHDSEWVFETLGIDEDEEEDDDAVEEIVATLSKYNLDDLILIDGKSYYTKL